MMKYLCVVTLVAVTALVFAEEPKNPTPAPPPNPATPAVSPIPPTLPAPTGPKMAGAKPAGQEWGALLDRLRQQPRAADLNNGALMLRLSDIFCDSGESKVKALSLQSEYDKALMEKGAKWENELKELRAQYEEKIIQEFPESKRESAKKLLDASRAKWAEASERDAKIRTEFMERMRTAVQSASANKPNPNAAPSPIKPPNPTEEATAWMRDERAKVAVQDGEIVQALRALLSKDDGDKLDRYNRMRPAGVPPVAQHPSATPVQPPRPPAEAPVTKSVTPVAPVVVPNPTELKKDSTTEKK